MRISFLNSKTPIPLIGFRLPGSNDTHTALVDTGSELTFIDKSFVQDNNIKFTAIDNEVRLNGIVSDTKRKVLIASPTIKFKGKGPKKAMTVKCIVMDLSTLTNALRSEYNEDRHIDMLLGSDFLKENNAYISYEFKHIDF